MKYLSFILMMLVVVACQHSHQHATQQAKEIPDTPTGSFGAEFSPDKAIPASEIASLFSETDSSSVVLSGSIKASCKHSGCWMDMDMGNGSVVHVTFKDDEFAIPLDAAGKQAITQGMAYRKMIPVETLQNYAREEGLSEEEIAAITEPAWNYEIVATGVLIEE
jgi:hypothetical protein